MHNLLGGCFGAAAGFVMGGFAGLVLVEPFVRPGLDSLGPKFAAAGVAGLIFAAIGYKAGKWLAGRQNPTE